MKKPVDSLHHRRVCWRGQVTNQSGRLVSNLCRVFRSVQRHHHLRRSDDANELLSSPLHASNVIRSWQSVFADDQSLQRKKAMHVEALERSSTCPTYRARKMVASAWNACGLPAATPWPVLGIFTMLADGRHCDCASTMPRSRGVVSSPHISNTGIFNF